MRSSRRSGEPGGSALPDAGETVIVEIKARVPDDAPYGARTILSFEDIVETDKKVSILQLIRKRQLKWVGHV